MISRGLVSGACFVLVLLLSDDAVSGVLLERMAKQSADGTRWVQLSGRAELTGFQADEPPPALILDADGSFLQPRLGLLLDAGLANGVQAHVQVTADRGLDPGYRRNGQLRLDEYFVQIDMVDVLRGQIRIGKFSTAFGSWVSRHQSTDNPLISAPLLYEDMVTITDAVVPSSVQSFVSRRDTPENKPAWLPVIWGPSYASGLSFSGGFGDFDFTVEAKNASVSSRPAVWDAIDTGWDTDPIWTTRLSWHPLPEVSVGLSHTNGPYLRARAKAALDPGDSVNDFDQRVTALDFTWERRQVQLWVELMRSDFDVPRVGNVKMTGGFAEVRWKFAPLLWVAGRWNRSVFGETPGGRASWDRDISRFDVGFGYRAHADLQFKLEYGRNSASGPDVMGRDVIAAQVVWTL
jgi:hypothetical protein